MKCSANGEVLSKGMSVTSNVNFNQLFPCASSFFISKVFVVEDVQLRVVCHTRDCWIVGQTLTQISASTAAVTLQLMVK